MNQVLQIMLWSESAIVKAAQNLMYVFFLEGILNPHPGIFRVSAWLWLSD